MVSKSGESCRVGSKSERSAGLSRREDSGDVENHESPRKGLQGGGGRKSMKEEKIKAVI